MWIVEPGEVVGNEFSTRGPSPEAFAAFFGAGRSSGGHVDDIQELIDALVAEDQVQVPLSFSASFEGERSEGMMMQPA